MVTLTTPCTQRLNAFADNWSYATTDPQHHLPAITTLTKIADALAIAIDWGKTWAWGTSSQHQEALQIAKDLALNPEVQLQSVTHARDLGYIMHYRLAPFRGTQKERHKQAIARLDRLRKSDLPVQDKAYVAMAAGVTKALYGTHMYLVGEEYFSQLRSKIATALLGPHHNIQSHLACSCLSPTLVDPELWVIQNAIKEARLFLLEAAPDLASLFLRMAANHRVRYNLIVGPAMALSAYLAKLGWTLNQNGAIQCTQFNHLHLIHCNQDQLMLAAERAWMDHVSLSVSNRHHLRNLPRIDNRATIKIFQQVPPDRQRSVGLDICMGYMLNDQKSHFDASQDPACQFCAQPDTVQHRVLHCEATQVVRAKFPAVCVFLTDHDIVHTLLPAIYADPEVDFHSQIFERYPEPQCSPLPYPPKYIFTDGSCKLPADPAHRWASYAIVTTQYDIAQLPPDRLNDAPWLLGNCFDTIAASHVTGPQTIPRAELFGATLAQEMGLQVPIVTDSQYVVFSHQLVTSTPHVWKLAKKKNFDLLRRLHDLHWNRRLDIPVLKVKSHQRVSLSDPEAFLKLGNAVADSAATQTQEHLARSLTMQLASLADDSKQMKQMLSDHLTMRSELAELRKRLESDTVQHEAVEPRANFFKRYTVADPVKFTFTAEQFEHIHASKFGSYYSALVLEWLQSLEWPRQPDRQKPPVGVTWLELACNFMYTTQHSLMVNVAPAGQPTKYSCTEDDITVDHTAHCFSMAINALRDCIAHLSFLLQTDLLPTMIPQKVTSIRKMGGNATKQGIPFRPVMRCQAETVDMLLAYFDQQQGSKNFNQWPQDRLQGKGDLRERWAETQAPESKTACVVNRDEQRIAFQTVAGFAYGRPIRAKAGLNRACVVNRDEQRIAFQTEEYLNWIPELDAQAEDVETLLPSLFAALQNVYAQNYEAEVMLQAGGRRSQTIFDWPPLRFNSTMSALLRQRLKKWQSWALEGLVTSGLAEWLSARPVAAVLAGVLFVHGGVPSELSLLQIQQLGPGFVVNVDEFFSSGRKELLDTVHEVVTYRGFHGRRGCREVDQVLHLLKEDDVQMIVVGHTAGKTVRQTCGDRLVAADSSLSRFYRSYGNRYCPVQVATERHGTCSRKLSPCAGQAARVHEGRVTLVNLENVREELVGADKSHGMIYIEVLRSVNFPIAVLQCGGVHFYIKQGCSIRKLRAGDEMATSASVKGINSFRPQRHIWPHPAGVIGAGYNGLKTAMIYAKALQRINARKCYRAFFGDAVKVKEQVNIKDGQGNVLRYIQLKTKRPDFLADASSIPETTRFIQGSDPTKWAMTDVQLTTFFSYVRSRSEYKAAKQARGHVCLYDVNTLFVIPWTRGHGCGVALLFNAHVPLEAQVMISHAWAEDVEELVLSLSSWASRIRPLWSCSGVPLWCCTFAQYQPEDGAGPSLQKQLSLDPFKSVIQSRPLHGMLVVHTTKADPYERLWCVHEIDEALDSKLYVTAVGTYSPGGRTVRTQSAKCGHPADENRIRAVIEGKAGGYERLDRTICAFRNTLLKSGASVFAEIQVPWENCGFDGRFLHSMDGLGLDMICEELLEFCKGSSSSLDNSRWHELKRKFILIDRDGCNIEFRFIYRDYEETGLPITETGIPILVSSQPINWWREQKCKLEIFGRKPLAKHQFPLKMSCALDPSNRQGGPSQNEVASAGLSSSEPVDPSDPRQPSYVLKRQNVNVLKHPVLCQQWMVDGIEHPAPNRLAREVFDILENPTENADLLRFDFSKGDLSRWTVYLKGPIGTPYDAGWFAATFDIPRDYPWSGPKNFKISTRILHPNVSADTGEVCMDILSEWLPHYRISRVLVTVVALLGTPEPLDPVNVEAARLLLDHPELFAEKARHWTRSYALPEPPSFRDLGYGTLCSL
eukprot:s2088_g2.t1